MEPSSTPSEHIPDPPPPEPERAAKEGILRRQGAQVQERLRPIARKAEALSGRVHQLMLLSLISGLWLWGRLFFPFTSLGRTGILVLALLVLIMLLAPAGVFFLFRTGLRQVITLPDRLAEMAGTGEDSVAALYDTVTGRTEPRKTRRLWGFFRAVLDLRSLLLKGKGEVLRVAAVARIINPFFIGLLFFSFVYSLLLIAVATVMIFLTALF
ncbi:MAG: hypothetical protein ACE5G0_17920 [Rhodothermales bacterium]